MNLKNNRGSVLLSVFFIGTTIMVLIMLTFKMTQATTESVEERKDDLNAFNIAESGKEIALADLRSGKFNPEADSTIVFYTKFPFGSGYFSVTCEGSHTLDTIKIVSIGVHGDQKVIIEALCELSFNTISVNCNVEAAVTARASVKTLGNVTIDGRDWDTSGTTIIGTGIKGVKTLQDVDQGGASKIGGDSNAPAKKVSDPAIIEEFASSAPATPEEALGLPAGILDTYKSDTLPTLPFDGICYYSPSGGVKAPDLTGSRGIFICHNDSYSAVLRNFHGDFKGLIICDNFDKFNGNASVLGAVIALSNSTEENTFSNGTADIMYSSGILADLGAISVQVGGANYDVVSWRQLK